MVGSPVVARVMMKEGGAFGGEENGGLIFPEFQYCRDGAMAVAKMLEIVATQGRLSKVNDAIPQYSQFKTKVTCPEGKKASSPQRNPEVGEVRQDRHDRWGQDLL